MINEQAPIIAGKDLAKATAIFLQKEMLRYTFFNMHSNKQFATIDNSQAR